MMRSIAECRTAGIVFEANEAVAIAQQLITGLCQPRNPADVRPPFGPPSPETVFLKDDGSVVCCSCQVTPAVSEVAILLDQMLSDPSVRAAGALRYTIARALLNVDVPPFDSLDEFSRDLSRHERGNRADNVRRALARARGVVTLDAASGIERRRNGTAVTTLRRELREADVRLYQHRAGTRDEAASIIDLVAAAPPASHGRRLSAAAACVGLGLSLIGAGELMHRPSTPAAAVPAPSATPPAAPLVAQAQAPLEIRTVSDEPRPAPERPIISRERGIIAVRDVAPRSVRSSRSVANRGPVKRSVRQPPVTVRRQSPSGKSRGVLDRLRLGWLRRAFTTHSDL